MLPWLVIGGAVFVSVGPARSSSADPTSSFWQHPSPLVLAPAVGPWVLPLPYSSAFTSPASSLHQHLDLRLPSSPSFLTPFPSVLPPVPMVHGALPVEAGALAALGWSGGGRRGVGRWGRRGAEVRGGGVVRGVVGARALYVEVGAVGGAGATRQTLTLHLTGHLTFGALHLHACKRQMTSERWRTFWEVAKWRSYKAVSMLVVITRPSPSVQPTVTCILSQYMLGTAQKWKYFPHISDSA